MENLDFLVVLDSVNLCADNELENIFSELHPLIDQMKNSEKWENIKNSSAFIEFEKAVKKRMSITENESALIGCLSILTICEAISDVSFIIKSLSLATRKVRRADAVLYAAVRYALSADLLDDDSYVEACGGFNMTGLECDKHLRVAEKILHPLGISTTVG